MPEPENALAAEMLTDATIRQVVHLSMGGGELRAHLSNAFGVVLVRVDGVHVARVAMAAAIPLEC
ncbi:hypothetical protein GOB94_12470 [Granulicella sp. 5B5]|uniref:hypothetical protein n=1 Tax=Granulicella sp. 5B5 TaxID=1617967 RepID=UPI0015F5B953|nr:hypothetical protein [Granulicella sp. 5B5]QMV19405.1 hypothetical protein GOB94_12470 [Granulicella sp. 5B5]